MTFIPTPWWVVLGLVILSMYIGYKMNEGRQVLAELDAAETAYAEAMEIGGDGMPVTIKVAVCYICGRPLADVMTALWGFDEDHNVVGKHLFCTKESS